MNARSPYWNAAIAGLALALGLFGLRWGLPSRARLERVLPPGLDTPAFRQGLMDSWSKREARYGSDVMLSAESWSSGITGVQRAAPGWTRPPELLESSLRSFYLRTAHEDEQSFLIVLSRMRPWRLELNPHLFIYGGAYIYSLGAWLAVGGALHLAALHTSLAPYMADPAQLGSLYYFGRLYSLACCLGCALLLLRIGRRHLGAETGIFAAVFFLLSPGIVVNAHVQKPHMLWALFVVWTLDLSLGLLASGGLAAYAAAGAASGLAVGTFLAAWPACFVVGFACALRIAALRKPPAAELRGLALAAASSVAAFFATNPYWIFDWKTARLELKVVGGMSHFDPSHPFVFLHQTLASSVTWPVLALMAAGAALALWKGRREPALWLVLFAFLAGLTLMATIPGTTVSLIRYFLGFLAVGQLLAGRAAAELLSSRPSLRPWALAALALAAANLALAGTAYAYNFSADSGERSTHVQAGAWIDAHVPPEASLGLLRLPQPSNVPYFRFDRHDLRFIESAAAFAALPPSALPEYVAVTSPDYDDRPGMEPNLSRYELAAEFDRTRLVPWIEIDPRSTTADPRIDLYRLKKTR